MAEYILQMENITKVYGNGIVANKDINFCLKEGEIHALVGENGAGKSTLMKILFGMEKPTSGKLMLRGKEMNFNSSKDAIANGIGMVHQHFMLVESFTVAQNIMLGIEAKKGIFVDEKQSVKFTQELGDKYNLKVDPTAKVSDISVGMKQKIEILKALARGAKILVLDEPTAVLTPQETDLLFEELIQLKKQGHTIVFISHKIREVKAISDRITVMRAGKYEGTFETEGVSEQEISNRIVGRDIVMHYDKQPANIKETKLKVEDLSYLGESPIPVLRDINFSLKGGTILGIAGVEGNGQGELIELLTRQRNIESGKITINGQNIAKMSIKELRDTGFGYIPEDRLRQGTAKEGSIKENYISNTYTAKKFYKGLFFRDKLANEVSEKAIEDYKVRCYGYTQKISMLSGGNMQKVVVARECDTHPEVLIAEQPTRGVDIGAAQIIHQKLIELRDRGTGVLLVSADLNEVLELSDELLVIYDGEIVAYFEDTKQVTENELGLCMLGLKRHTNEQIGRALSE
ncbi:MAG: ABC transporter ATP-binding protein [Cellulosilyticaceae bacterium]